jgi:small subunit ribosomal protein S3
MIKKNNVLIPNIPDGRNWFSSWYVHKKEYSSLLQEELLLITYARSVLFSTKTQGLIGVRVYRYNNILIIDMYLSFITFLVKKVFVLFVTNVNAFFKKSIILTYKKISLNNILTNGFFMAFKIAKLIEKRVKFRSKIIKSLLKEVSTCCVGIYVQCTGRINDANIARNDKLYVGSVSLNTISSYISYGLVIANTVKGLQSIKVWICVN